jgi:hypothetical protein
MPISLLIYSFDAKKLFNYYEFFLIFFLTLNICFIFGIFGPVFIDRSISYQMVMSASRNQIKISSLNRTCSESNTKRLVELENLGLIEIRDSYYIVTEAGMNASKLWHFIGKYTGTLEESQIFQSTLLDEK